MAARGEGSVPAEPQAPQRHGAGAANSSGTETVYGGPEEAKPEDLVPGPVVMLKLQKVPIFNFLKQK